MADEVAGRAPAGWYPVEGHPSQLRFWDGGQWTNHIHDAKAPPLDGPSAEPAPPTKRRRWPWAVGAAVVVAIVVIGGATFVITKSDTRDVEVSVVLLDFESSQGSCTHGAGGYSDIGQGNPVTIENEKGTILASGALPAGTKITGGCSFDVTLSGVPTDAKQYGATVGRRGTVTNSHDELAANDWQFGLSIGGS